MTNPRLLNWQQQNEYCFISIHGGLPTDQTSAHLSYQYGRRDPGQEYHQGKTQLHPTGVGDFLATDLEDSLTQYNMEDLPDSYRADTGALIKANKSAYENGLVLRPRQVGVGYPPHQSGNILL